MRRLSSPQVLFALAALTGVALGLTLAQVRGTGRLDPFAAGPTITLLLTMLVLPFVLRTRRRDPANGPAALVCAACTTVWDPARDGIAFCPGCGKHPKPTARPPASPPRPGLPSSRRA